MTVTLTDLVRYTDELLSVANFEDYCPNGLQVEGAPQVARIATGVTACQALLDSALAWGAHAIVVHHGYFWRGEAEPVVGMKRRRLAALLSNDASLLAYHLPLDAHPQLGNNARLGHLLGFAPEDLAPLAPAAPNTVGNIALYPEAVTATALAARLQEALGRAPLVVGDGDARLQRIAWCTGAAQGYIDHAITAGADAYITGEVSEQTVHIAREQGVHFFAAGHHATERYGVQALGEHLAEKFVLEHQFFDIDNPV